MKAPEKTQRQVVIEILEERGDRGAHSFEFIQARIPRVAARVCELRAEGHSIDSEPEALHGAAKGVRYTLQSNAGVESDRSAQPLSERLAEVASETKKVTLDSGVAASSSSLAPASEAHARTIPSAYECWVEDEAA